MTGAEKPAGQRARQLFWEGRNCAQSVLGAFAPGLGLPLETALALTAGLGGGIGRLRETCGAVLGMALALSLARAGDWEKGTLYQAEQELVGRFRREQGSLLCRELLGEAGRDRAARPSPRTPAYYAARPCPRLVERAAQLLEDYLAEHPPACPPRLPGG